MLETMKPPLGRSTSCPPPAGLTSTRPPLKRTHSSSDLTSALHLIGLVDSSDGHTLKSPPTLGLANNMDSLFENSEKLSNIGTSSKHHHHQHPRSRSPYSHGRKPSLNKRKKSITSIPDRPSLKMKRARSNDGMDQGRTGTGTGSYSGFQNIQKFLAQDLHCDVALATTAAAAAVQAEIVSHLKLADTSKKQQADNASNTLPVSPGAIPRSPSCIGLLEADAMEGGGACPDGYTRLGSISAVVSPTTLHPDDPATMFLEQAQKLDRRLRSEAMRIGATAVANSTIISVDDSGAMEASGIALVITQPDEA